MFRYKDDKTIFHRIPIGYKSLLGLAILAAAFLTRDLRVLGGLLALNLIFLVVARYRNFLKIGWMIFLMMGLPVLLLYYFIRPPLLVLEVVVLRVFIAFTLMALMTSTTDVMSILRLMKRLRFPRSIYLSIYIMLRFLPEVEYEYRELRDILKIRGIRFRVLKAGTWLPYLRSFFVPLVVMLLNRAEEIAIAVYLRE